MRQFKIMILPLLVLISATAYAAGNVEIHFNYPDDSIYIGITNKMEVWIENDDTIAAMSLGLEFSGYGGVVTWDVPISEGGLIPQPFVDQLVVLGDHINP